MASKFDFFVIEVEAKNKGIMLGPGVEIVTVRICQGLSIDFGTTYFAQHLYYRVVDA